MNIQNYTNKVIAEKYAENKGNYVFVSWALKLMEYGIESESLYILGGLDSKSGEEIELYFNRTVEELGIKILKDEVKLQNIYTLSLYQQILESRLTEREAIQKMWFICGMSEYHHRFSDFYNLNQDIESIEYGEGSVYDKTMNSGNFDTKVVFAFKKYSEEIKAYD